MQPGTQIQLVGINNGVIVQSQPPIRLVGKDGKEQQQIPITEYCGSFDELVEYLRGLVVIDKPEDWKNKYD